MVSFNDKKLLDDYLAALAAADRETLIRVIMAFTIVESQETARENIKMLMPFITGEG